MFQFSLIILCEIFLIPKKNHYIIIKPFTDEAQTALFKDPVRTAL